MKITQKLRKITTDFTDLENQYSSNSIVIPVEFIDNTFQDYIKFASIEVKTNQNYNWIIPLTNDGKIVLPSASTFFAGVITISIFGIKGDTRITTDKVQYRIIPSNPTGESTSPISTDWVTIMNQEVTAQITQLGEKIKPTINEENKRWYIGGVDTGVVALGTATVPIATKSLLGGIIVSDDFDIGNSGLLKNKTNVLIKRNVSVNIVANSDSSTQEKYPYKAIATFNGCSENYIPNYSLSLDHFDLPELEFAKTITDNVEFYFSSMPDKSSVLFDFISITKGVIV